MIIRINTPQSQLQFTNTYIHNRMERIDKTKKTKPNQEQPQFKQ